MTMRQVFVGNDDSAPHIPTPRRVGTIRVANVNMEPADQPFRNRLRKWPLVEDRHRPASGLASTRYDSGCTLMSPGPSSPAGRALPGRTGPARLPAWF